MLTPPVTSLTPHKLGRWERAAGEGDWLSDVIIPPTPSSEGGTGWGMSKLDVRPEVLASPSPSHSALGD